MRMFSTTAIVVLLSVAVMAQAPAASLTGLWQATDVSAGPWSIELTQNGSALTGTVRQTGAQGGPVAITEGSVAGSTLTFKAVSPDGARTITFTGTVKGDAIDFKRAVEVRNNTVGGTGIFGGRAVAEFMARRANPGEAAAAASTAAAPAAGARGARGARGTAPAEPVNPNNSPDGKWTATAVGGGPWTFEFSTAGSALNGSVRQAGPPETSAAIAAGKIEGTRISFTVRSPDGARTVTFVGRVSGGEISFVRQFDFRPGSSRGSNDLFGALSSLQFVAKRVAP